MRDTNPTDREIALIQECARLILANEANAEHYAKLRNYQTKQNDLVLSRNSWRARAIAAERIILEALKRSTPDVSVNTRIPIELPASLQTPEERPEREDGV